MASYTQARLYSALLDVVVSADLIEGQLSTGDDEMGSNLRPNGRTPSRSAAYQIGAHFYG